MIWRFRGREMAFERVRLMGILNVTPDSFSDGGEFLSKEKAIEKALQIEKAGADLIDIGGESTRPGAQSLSEEEELSRVLPVIQSLRSLLRIPISIDTTKPRVARACLEAGAEIINDVDGLHAADEMADVAREYGAGLVLMHRRGTPETMQRMTQYEEVVQEVLGELRKSLEEVIAAGVAPEQIALDPGIGFSKTAEQNLELIAELHGFQSLARPLLVGPSRKSFIGKITDKTPAERDGGTAGAVAWAVAQGVQILRVHNVALMRDVVKVTQAIVASGFKPVLEG